MKKLKVGLIGCGTIGTELAFMMKGRRNKPYRLSYVCDLQEEKVYRLRSLFSRPPQQLTFKQLILKSDVIIEAASVRAARESASFALKHNKRILIMSIGGIRLTSTLKKLIRQSRGELLLPSGALAGMDAIAAAKASEIESVELTTTKPVKGLIGAPFFDVRGVDPARIKKKRVLFEGSAEEAIKLFPKNVNVAMILSLATLGPKKITVRIVTSPHLRRNTHEVVVKGSFGVIRTTTENVPCPTNPKTSYLAVLSAYATLERMTAPLHIGT